MLRSVPTAPKCAFLTLGLCSTDSFGGDHFSTCLASFSWAKKKKRKKARKMAKAECVHSGMFSFSPEMVPNKDYELELKNTSNES